ncbi:MAG: S8 family serine peptidase, partial [Acidobacteria bacterium]|nr:S8 family serine peptidase [Acidobacteriota bacterium]
MGTKDPIRRPLVRQTAEIGPQSLLHHRRRQIGSAPLGQGARHVGGASQPAGHAVGVVERGEQLDYTIHRRQGALSTLEIAGTIAQTTNNSYGLAGIAYKATIMPIKVCGQDPVLGYTCPTDDIADGIRWAAERGAKVINISLSDTGDVTAVEREALQFARDTGAVV